MNDVMAKIAWESYRYIRIKGISWFILLKRMETWCKDIEEKFPISAKYTEEIG